MPHWTHSYNCKQLEPAFAHLQGAEPLPFEDQLKFSYKVAHREIENKQRDNTKKDLLRPQSTAFAAADLNAAQVQTAAATPPARRRRTRSPRNARTDTATQNSALAAVSPSPQPLVAVVCYSFQTNCRFQCGDDCRYERFDSTGKEIQKPKATAKPNGQAKNR